jgi:hypothetical protein
VFGTPPQILTENQELGAVSNGPLVKTLKVRTEIIQDIKYLRSFIFIFWTSNIMEGVLSMDPFIVEK